MIIFNLRLIISATFLYLTKKSRIRLFYSPFNFLLMRRLLFLLVFTGLVFTVHSQNTTYAVEQSRSLYIGIGTGIESFSGMVGVTADIKAKENLFVRLGAGLGGWGGKLSVGIRGEKRAGNSIGYGAFFSYASGLKEFTTNLETTTGNKDVKLKLSPVMVITPEFSYKWIFGNGHRFFISGGYGVPLQSNHWEVLDGSQLTDDSKKVMRILTPGGLSIGLGFQFAL
jgi:hypothetical protein